ncbi:ComEC/Rec2 family competence protein [Microbacterium luticocti]|uniref:ComEC/Rec2 family competence protein n=1 Tax=Microbacterium luticocti TaxID=451764 RepID=UPI000413B0B8|nr:ComEC/Rec2 family competence protein [Microbacterium luticocti]
MRVRDLRLVPVAAAAWAACAAAVYLPAAAGPIALALWATVGVLVLVLAVGAGRRWHTLWAIAAVAFALAAAAASHVALTMPAREAAAHLAVGGGRAIVVHATVQGKAERTARGDIAFDAVADEIDIGTQRHRVDVPVSIRVDDTRPDVGARVVVAGTAMRTDPGRRAVLVVRASGEITVVAQPQGPAAVAAGMRHALARATEGLPEPAAGLIPGLAVGDTGGVSVELDAAMKASSLSHLTAVSGANCAIVVGLAFGAAALCGARRAIRVLAGLLALAGFVLLVTPEPSVVRAAAMAAIAMLGVLLGRRGTGVALLCAAVTGSLLLDPWLSGSLGFALSVAATAALLVLAAPLAAGMGRVLPRAIALGLAVPLAAQLACGPWLVLINPTVPLYGVAANLLAAPAAPIATVLGLAACVAAPVLAPLGSGLVALTWLPAAWISATAFTATELPAAAVPWPEGVAGAIALTVMGAAVTVLLLPPGAGRFARLLRRVSAAGVAVVIGVCTGTAATRTVAGPLTLPANWAIAACDIGQGDALLVRSAGAIALIDTGPDPALLKACLDRFGIGRIDLLVLTHYDLDHIGGLEAAAPLAVRVLHGPPDGASDRRRLAEAASGGAEVVDASAGMTGVLGGATWTVLWPRAGDRAFGPGNQSSVTVDIRGGGVPPAVFLGDLDATAQRALAASGVLRPPYAVVKVAHHGSADQSPDLYRLLAGTVAVISVGAHNDYGHPRAPTLQFLHADGYVVARTDQDGVVTVGVDGDRLQVWRERAPPAVAGRG